MTPAWGRTSAAGTTWDAAVVGAGPAGAVAATLLARRGWRVALLEKSSWPRDKTCGGCLNGRAVDLLDELGMGEAIRSAAALHQVVWQIGGLRAQLPTRGVAVLRRDLDAALVDCAVRAGCVFLPATQARLRPGVAGDAVRRLAVQSGKEQGELSARVVLACDGLGGTLLADEPWARWRMGRSPWMGASTVLEADAMPVGDGTIHMHIGRGGYVGLVRLGDGRINLAAAVDPGMCRAWGGPGPLVASILGGESGRGPAELHKARFCATGLLTRTRPSLGGHRVLAVGDACGYVEPFTGEGMAWAMRAARDATSLLGEPAEAWPDDRAERWGAMHRRALGLRRRCCAMLRPIMHHVALAEVAVWMAWAWPAAGENLARWVSGAVRREPQAQQGAMG